MRNCKNNALNYGFFLFLLLWTYWEDCLVPLLVHCLRFEWLISNKMDSNPKLTLHIYSADLILKTAHRNDKRVNNDAIIQVIREYRLLSSGLSLFSIVSIGLRSTMQKHSHTKIIDGRITQSHCMQNQRTRTHINNAVVVATKQVLSLEAWTPPA